MHLFELLISILEKNYFNSIKVVKKYCNFDFALGYEIIWVNLNKNRILAYNNFFLEIIDALNSARYQAFESLNKYYVGHNFIKWYLKFLISTKKDLYRWKLGENFGWL